MAGTELRLRAADVAPFLLVLSKTRTRQRS